MKRLLLAISLVMLSAATSTAAGVRPYVSVSAGAFMPTDTKVSNDIGGSQLAAMDTGYLVTGAFGIAFGQGMRLEAEVSHRKADFGTSQSAVPAFVVIGFRNPGAFDLPDTIVATTGMINVFYDQNTGTMITPYIGGGFGVSHVDIENKATASPGLATAFRNPGTSASGNDTVFAYQAGAGLGLDLSKNVTIDLGYRFFGMETFSFGNFKARLESHNATLGLRYTF